VKVQKAGRIGVVVSDQVLRAAQRVDGHLVTASVPFDKDLKRSLKQLLTSSPFVGKDVVVGVEGSRVLVESLVVPPGASKSAQAVSAERLKGDPVFNETNAALSVAVASSPSGGGPSMVIHAAVIHERIAQIMTACRELQLQVLAVEAAALAAWRAWSGAGLQVRLVRTATADIVQAGMDGKLLFCRIVDQPISSIELRATISRAASLLSTDGFDVLTCSGVEPEERHEMVKELGMAVEQPAEPIDDAEAVGLATDGVILTEFTPPEERLLRIKRKVRKVRTYMCGAAGVLVAVAGLLGYQRIDSLKTRQLLLEQQAQSAQAAEAALAAAQAQLGLVKSAAEHLAGARPGHHMSVLFSLISNTAPEQMILESIKVDDVPAHVDDSARKDKKKDKDKEETPTTQPRVVEARLAGLAGSDAAVRDYADGLIATGAFSDVRIEASERVILENGSGGERFRIFAAAETR